MDNFTLLGTEDFIKEVLETISRELTKSKIERDNFRYNGMDISTVEDCIDIQMEDYVDSLVEIKKIQEADKDDDLIKVEMKEYRKITGKLSWLANSTHPDLSFTALTMSKRNNSAKIYDLKKHFKSLEEGQREIFQVEVLKKRTKGIFSHHGN